MRWTNGIAGMLAAVVVAGACKANDRSQGGPADESDASSRAEVRQGAPGRADAIARQAGQPMQMEVAPSPAVMASAPPAPQAAAATADAATSMIIRTGSATIKVDSLEPAVARLRVLAQSLGGFVGNTSMQTGKDQLRSATVEMKVPAERWPQLLSGLKPIGTLESQDENAQEVGEEFVDVQARVANSRRLEERLIALLANRTGKLQDALMVERELARVREEIDRYEGRLRYLRTRTAISTMVITVHEPGPVLGTKPGVNPIADAFRNAWQIFIGLIAFLIASLGVLIPIGIILWLVSRWKKRAPKSTE